MKKFKFTLQTVHRVREIKQEKEEFTLSQMQSELNRAAERISEIEAMQQTAMENYTLLLRRTAAINVGEIEMQVNHIVYLNLRRKQAQELLEQQRQSCRRQQTTLAAATREVKVTEKLRETQQQRHRAELERREQSALDEIISNNYARRMF